jgi:hypothetical protein
MTIDILHYELKYKHDRDVLDLLAAYQSRGEELEDKVYTQGDMDIAEHEARDSAKGEINDFADDIDDALETASGAIAALEGLAKRMRA